MGTSRAFSGGIVPRDVIFIGTLKLPGDQDLALNVFLNQIVLHKNKFVSQNSVHKYSQNNSWHLMMHTFVADRCDIIRWGSIVNHFMTSTNRRTQILLLCIMRHHSYCEIFKT